MRFLHGCDCAEHHNLLIFKNYELRSCFWPRNPSEHAGFSWEISSKPLIFNNYELLLQMTGNSSKFGISDVGRKDHEIPCFIGVSGSFLDAPYGSAQGASGPVLVFSCAERLTATMGSLGDHAGIKPSFTGFFRLFSAVPRYSRISLPYPIFLSGYSITAPDAETLAQIWLNMAVLWRDAAAALEALRLTTAAAIEAAGTMAEVDAAMADVREA